MNKKIAAVLKALLCILICVFIGSTIYSSREGYETAVKQGNYRFEKAAENAKVLKESADMMIANYEKGMNNFTTKVDSTTKAELPFASQFDDVYAVIQRVLGKQKYNYSTIAKDGYLIVTTPQMTDEQIMIDVNGVLTLTDVAKSVGADVFAVQTPMRYIVGETELPPSVEDFSHYNADCYLAKLREYGFTDNILDLREYEDRYGSQDVYYATDHHWKIETSLLAAQDITAALNDTFGYMLDETAVNPVNYSFDLWKYQAKGSWARRTNPYFITAEDFTVVKPKFDTNFTLKQYGIDGEFMVERNGTFENTIIFEEGLPTEKYLKDYADLGYYAYLNATYTSWIKNHNANNDRKVLIFGDSSCRALGSFLSLVFSETLVIDTDPERYQISLDETILEYEPDLVLFVSTVELDATDRFEIKRGEE